MHTLHLLDTSPYLALGFHDLISQSRAITAMVPKYDFILIMPVLAKKGADTPFTGHKHLLDIGVS